MVQAYTPLSQLPIAISLNGAELVFLTLPQPGNLNVPYVSETATVAQIAAFRSGVWTVATLPAGYAGAQSFVTDSTVVAAGNFGAAVSGGGVNHVPVYYDDGALIWRIG